MPLYRRVITGQAIEQGSEYGGRNAKDAGAVAGDETEDLFELLSTVYVIFLTYLLPFANKIVLESRIIQIFRVCQLVLFSQIISE